MMSTLVCKKFNWIQMINQNSPQRMNELQLCKGGARMQPNEIRFLRCHESLCLPKHFCLQDGDILSQCILEKFTKTELVFP